MRIAHFHTFDPVDCRTIFRSDVITSYVLALNLFFLRNRRFPYRVPATRSEISSASTLMLLILSEIIVDIVNKDEGVSVS